MRRIRTSSQEYTIAVSFRKFVDGALEQAAELSQAIELFEINFNHRQINGNISTRVITTVANRKSSEKACGE